MKVTRGEVTSRPTVALLCQRTQTFSDILHDALEFPDRHRMETGDIQQVLDAEPSVTLTPKEGESFGVLLSWTLSNAMLHCDFQSVEFHVPIPVISVTVVLSDICDCQDICDYQI